MPRVVEVDECFEPAAVHAQLGHAAGTRRRAGPVRGARTAGARGYILKGADPDQIVRAIVAVAAGEIIFGAALANRMAAFFRGGTRSTAPAFPALSTREHDVLDLIAAGLSNSAIAERLGLSEKTIRNNVSSIFTKLQVTDRPSAIVRARDAGLGKSGKA